uniref:Galactokinase 2 n=1 Tax=Ovis aries TaxID=9940 RepID=A0AC11EHT6_SHEEP
MATEGPAVRRVQVAEHPRLLKLKEMFNSKFGSIPKFYVRAPGRVNIIGEHIDYCGYSVLPMAVEQDMLIAVEPVKTHVLQLANTNPLYPLFLRSQAWAATRFAGLWSAAQQVPSWPCIPPHVTYHHMAVLM